MLMKCLRKLTLVLLGMLGTTVVWSQATISGLVTDANGEPLIGATILLENTSTGTATDLDGRFIIEGIDPGVYTITFSYTGFASQSEEVVLSEGEDREFRIVLRESATTLDELVVVGYGVQRKRDLAGNIAKVEGTKLLETVTPSFESALQGQAPGVNVIQGSGLAGSGSVVRIRGISSISATADPLYVVDGVPIDVNYFLAEANWQNGAFNNNPLAALNPNDIESIEVLKDASAAGIYGSRGANGVILITTKRAKKGRPSVNFRMQLGTSDPTNRPDFLDSRQWLALRQEAWELDGNTGAVWVPNYSSPNDSPEARAAAFQQASAVNTDWWDLLTQTGVKQEYNLGMSFTKNIVGAYIGLTYGDADSYIAGNNLKRYNVRTNLDFNFSPKLTFKLSGSYNYSVNQRVRVSYTGGLGDAMSVALPIYPVFDDDGTYWRGENSMNAPNPVFSNDNFEGYTLDHRVLTSGTLVYQATDRLTFTATGGYDYYLQNNDQYDELDFAMNPLNRAERDIREVNNYNANVTAQYDVLQAEDNRLSVMLGSEYQEKVTNGENNIVYFGVESTQFRGRGDFGEESRDLTNYFVLDDDRENFISYFTRTNYTLKNRYVFQATARVDGSSKFGENNRYGFFPSLSAGWIVSEEPFFQSGVVNYMKLKSSFGILGNAGIPSNQWIGTINPVGVYNGEPIRYLSRFNNPNLKWETTNTFDAGIELGLFDDKLSVEASYYLKNTKDALLQLTVPGYYGFGGSFWDNVAEVLNTGFEFNMDYYVVNNAEFQWKTNLNFGYNYNEIISIGDYTEDAVSGGTNDTRVVEGFPVGTNFLIPYLGVDPDNGRPIYEDINGNPTYEYNEARDRQPVGDVLPDLTGGFSNNISYKNFDLSFLFVFSTGYDIYDSSSKRQFGFLTDWNVVDRVADRWMRPGDDAAYPRVTLDPAAHGNDKEWFNTSLWLQDGSYIRLRNLAFGYNLPSSLLERIGVQSARISVGGTNLLTFTNFEGLDPEVVRDFDNVNDRNLSPNITYLTPPQEKSYTLTLNVKF